MPGQVEGGGPRPKNPIPTVDVIVELRDGIVLVDRRNPPHGWALPGGFIDYGESAESAAAREVREETNLRLSRVRQFHVYSDPGRDCRMHTITTVFVARGEGTLRAGDDANAARVFRRGEIPDEMAFDHRGIVNDYLEHRWGGR
jgi:ADP-ribose pyrophosphatase YjhB (NUDIX family)